MPWIRLFRFFLSPAPPSSVPPPSFPSCGRDWRCAGPNTARCPRQRWVLALHRAEPRPLPGHAKMSRLVARLVPFYEFDINKFFCSDGAPAAIASQRQEGFFRLAGHYRERFARGPALTLQAATRISDLQFTEAYRVPFQYSRLVREHLGTSAFVESSAGGTVTHLARNTYYRLTGR